MNHDDNRPAGDDWLAALLQSLRSDERVESISESRQEGLSIYRIEAREVPAAPWGGPRCYVSRHDTRGGVRRMLAQIGIEVRQ